MSAELPWKQTAPGAFPLMPRTPAAPSASRAHPAGPPPRPPGLLKTVAPREPPCSAGQADQAQAQLPPSTPAPAHPQEPIMEGGCSPGRAVTPRPQEAAAPEPGYGAQEGPNFPSPAPAPARVPGPGWEAAQRGCPGGAQGQLGMEVRGQEGLQKSQSRTRPRGQGEGLGPACLEMLGLLRAEPWQERPPLRPGPLHPVLGHPPPAASRQALSPEFTRNPVILQPLCQAGCLLRGSPSWPRPALHHVDALLSHTTRLYSRGRSGTLQDPHEAQRPSAPAPGLGALGCPPLVSPDKGCQSGDAPASSLQQLQRLAGRESSIARSSWLAPYWPLSLSCWYSLCSRMACSNKGRFIPSTHVSTRAFTTQLPSETHRHQGPGRVSNAPFRGVLTVSPQFILSPEFGQRV